MQRTRQVRAAAQLHPDRARTFQPSAAEMSRRQVSTAAVGGVRPSGDGAMPAASVLTDCCCWKLRRTWRVLAPGRRASSARWLHINTHQRQRGTQRQPPHLSASPGTAPSRRGRRPAFRTPLHNPRTAQGRGPRSLKHGNQHPATGTRALEGMQGFARTSRTTSAAVRLGQSVA